MCLVMAVASAPSAASEQCRQLHESRAARVTMSERTGRRPLLRLVALQEEVIDVQTIEQILQLTDELLDKGDHFESLWDLRLCKVPGVMVVAKCVRWALARKQKLDACNQRMAVCMPDRPALLAVVRMVLKVFGPVCPVMVSQVEDECEAFMSPPL